MNLIVTTLFLEIALILVPGFIWVKVQRSYGIKEELTPFDVVLNSFIYSVISYLTLATIYWIFGLKLKLLAIETDSKKIIPPEVIPEILEAVILSFVLSIFWLYATNYKLMTRSLQKLRATNTYGDEDVWNYILNSNSPAFNFIHFRDFEQQVVYAGDVQIFSETGKLREILLAGVTVYDFDGQRLYEIPSLYLSRAQENIHMEFPNAGLSARSGDEMAEYSYTFPGRRSSNDKSVE